jgi:hypothetical protein
MSGELEQSVYHSTSDLMLAHPQLLPGLVVYTFCIAAMSRMRFVAAV